MDEIRQPAQPTTEFTTLGYYEPGFIHLRVNTHDDLSGLSTLMSGADLPAWTPTFLHEYIHFLQDITTTHGLLNFIHAIEHLKNANMQVRNNLAAQFSLPLRISNDFNWQTNTKLKAIYRGCDDTADSIRYLQYRKTIENVASGNGKTISPPKYLVDYYDNGAQTKSTCHFGSVHLKEYMAHALQTQFDPANDHADIPYRLVELLVASEVPRFANDPSLVVALCDASLMNYHPTDLFFHAIERMKRDPESTPTDVESVYAFTYDGLRPEGCGSFDALFQTTTDDAVQQFRDSLKADIFRNNVQWFEGLIAEAKQLRLSKRGFFTKLVDSLGTFSPVFTQIVRSLGIPFTTNADFKGYFLAPENMMGLGIQPYYPKVFQAISQTYRGQLACSLHSFCAAEPEQNRTNADCLNQPWARVELPQLCPYAQMWKTWGLKGKIPVSRA